MWAVIAPRSLVPLLGALLLGAAACGGSQSSASSNPPADAPPPTIGLGFEFEPGTVTGVADLEAIERPDQVSHIVMIGDSITHGSSDELRTGFASLGFPDAIIEAQQDKRMTAGNDSNPAGADIARYVVGADPDGEHEDELWVVALGTNDINQYGSLDDIGTQVDELLAAIPEDAAVLWVNTFYAGSDGGDGEVNLMIADRLEQRGNAAIVPWSSYATGDGVLTGDGVHPTAFGQQVFAGLVVGAVGDLLADT
jgi:lysophospholipase L1-like esterase